jgi:hypothetical protein
MLMKLLAAFLLLVATPASAQSLRITCLAN